MVFLKSHLLALGFSTRSDILLSRLLSGILSSQKVIGFQGQIEANKIKSERVVPNWSESRQTEIQSPHAAFLGKKYNF